MVSLHYLLPILLGLSGSLVWAGMMGGPPPGNPPPGSPPPGNPPPPPPPGNGGCQINATHFYNFGEKWIDDCKTEDAKECTCMQAEGVSFSISCRGLCFTWGETVAQYCTFDPPPRDKCCKVLVCPDNIQIPEYEQN